MKPRTAWRRVRQGWQLLLLLALAWFPANRVVAGNPPPPSGRVPPSAPALARPAAGQATLYDQINSPSFSWISSQNSTDDPSDTRAADDFFVSTGSNSWSITAVEVAGVFNSGSGEPDVSSVNIEFYTSSGGKPAHLLYATNPVPISGTDSTGNFFLPVSPALNLASNANYWVSVQPVQSTSWSWGWSQRSPQSQDPAVWKNPNNGFTRGCIDWTAIDICFPDTGHDLLFRLYGAQSANHVTPILYSLNPNHGANHNIALNLDGAGFANGAVVNWTLGPTQHFSATVSNANQLNVVIPAAAVSNYGATVTVSVTNPGPCTNSCTSNSLPFGVNNPLLLPIIAR